MIDCVSSILLFMHALNGFFSALFNRLSVPLKMYIDLDVFVGIISICWFLEETINVQNNTILMIIILIYYFTVFLLHIGSVDIYIRTHHILLWSTN